MSRRHTRYTFGSYPCQHHHGFHIGRTGTKAEADRQHAVQDAVDITMAVQNLKAVRGW